MKVLVRFMFCFCLVILISGCSANNKTQEIILTIDDEVSYLSEALVYLDRVEKDFESIGGADIWDIDFDGKSAAEVAKERTLENIIKMKVISLKAYELGIGLTEEEEEIVEQQATEDWNGYTKEEVEVKGITKDILISLYAENTLTLKVYEAMTKNFKADEASIQAALNENAEYMAYQEADPTELLLKAKTQHIYIKTHDYDENNQWMPLPDESRDKALEQAEEALARARAGEDFEKLITIYSQDEDLKTDEVVFSKGIMNPHYEVTAYNLEPGDISDIVTTNEGYYIIKLIEVIAPTEEEVETYYEQFRDYEAQLRTHYENIQKEEAFNQQYNQWKATYDIQVNDYLWDEIKAGPEEEE